MGKPAQNQGILYDYIDGDGQLVTVFEWAVRATKGGRVRLIRVWAETEERAKQYLKDAGQHIMDIMPVVLE